MLHSSFIFFGLIKNFSKKNSLIAIYFSNYFNNKIISNRNHPMDHGLMKPYVIVNVLRDIDLIK